MCLLFRCTCHRAHIFSPLFIQACLTRLSPLCVFFFHRTCHRAKVFLALLSQTCLTRIFPLCVSSFSVVLVTVQTFFGVVLPDLLDSPFFLCVCLFFRCTCHHANVFLPLFSLTCLTRLFSPVCVFLFHRTCHRANVFLALFYAEHRPLGRHRLASGNQQR